jgi:Tfp pilus assembly protein PilO
LSLALVMAVILLYVAAVRPAVLRADAIGQRVTAQQAKLEVARVRVATLGDVERETHELQDRVDRADKQLAEPGDLPAVIGEVTQYGRDTLLRDVQWRADARPRRAQQLTELPIDISFSGDFAHVFDFLRQTEDMQSLARVKRLTLHKQDAAAAVQGQLTMNLYFMEQ